MIIIIDYDNPISDRLSDSMLQQLSGELVNPIVSSVC